MKTSIENLQLNILTQFIISIIISRIYIFYINVLYY